MTGATGPAGSSGVCTAGTTAYNGGSNGQSLSNSNTNYAALVSQTNPSITTTNGNATVYCVGTLSNFSVTLTGSPGTGNSYGFTVMANGSATAATCTISDSATSCSYAGTIVLRPGDVVNVRSTPNSNPTSRAATWASSFVIITPSGPIQQ